MKNKIIGIFLFMLLTVSILPSAFSLPLDDNSYPNKTPDTIKDASYLPLKDVLFDLKISFFMRLVGFQSLCACIINGDNISWSKEYGYYDVSAQKHPTIDTDYVLASITKTITGTALMQLYELDLFELDDDVNEILPFELRNPNFPDDPITYRMLLAHTSSLNTNNEMQHYYWLNFSGDPPFDFFPEPFLRQFLLPGGKYYDSSVWNTKYRPGEYPMYANIGFDIISYLVEILSGEPFLEYCDNHIFLPLDMNNTSFNLSHFDIDHVAIPYQRVMGRYLTLDRLGLPGQYWRMRFYPAGGLYSTVSDLSHFLIAHMNGGTYNNTQILKKETVALMHDAQQGNKIDYALAWYNLSIKGISISGHAGDLPGVDTSMYYNETKNIGVIYLANGNPYFSLLPLRGKYAVKMILYLLFTKDGTLIGDMQSDFTDSSDQFLITPFMIPG